MHMLFSIGVPLLELFFRFLIALYIFPLTLSLIGFRFIADGTVIIFKSRITRTRAIKYTSAKYCFGQGILGLVAAVFLFLIIFHRQEIIKCVIGLF